MKVLIELEFEKGEVSHEDIRDYLNELMEDDCLNATIVEYSYSEKDILNTTQIRILKKLKYENK